MGIDLALLPRAMVIVSDKSTSLSANIKHA
jgi:hypothetical protein